MIIKIKVIIKIVGVKFLRVLNYPVIIINLYVVMVISFISFITAEKTINFILDFIYILFMY